MQNDTTLNYQVLALDIVMAAIEDSLGDGEEALDAHEWLESIELDGLGIDGLEWSDLEASVDLGREE